MFQYFKQGTGSFKRKFILWLLDQIITSTSYLLRLDSTSLY